ncbi:MAG: RNA methyltransferase, partial [Alphaproteobacteria bacterium]|nr:RNA methyltransferase [Alphaproteobacteria bacterium]
LRTGQRCDISITTTVTGLDMLVIGEVDGTKLTRLATNLDLARLSLAPTPTAAPILLVQHRAPAIRFGETLMHAPANAFLQATPEGEAAIVAAVEAGIGKARQVADLYAGCGTIALRLAARAQVVAIDSAADSIAALDQAARSGGLGPRVRTGVRDLTRRPLIDDELRDLDAVVFDPPRDGARAQAEALARSAVPRVVAVSCNPASFARDARMLREGGYALDGVTPIDQFLWSPHVELIAVFTRPKARRSG